MSEKFKVITGLEEGAVVTGILTGTVASIVDATLPQMSGDATNRVFALRTQIGGLRGERSDVSILTSPEEQADARQFIRKDIEYKHSEIRKTIEHRPAPQSNTVEPILFFGAPALAGLAVAAVACGVRYRLFKMKHQRAAELERQASIDSTVDQEVEVGITQFERYLREH